jgi:translation initiation factor IF-3
MTSRGGIVDSKKFRINQQIRSQEVRLIDSDGAKVGIVSVSDALAKAQGKGLDLVEVSAQAVPPVCRIVSFSKFKYEINKKEKEAKKKQKNIQLKEIRVRPRIGENDLEIKIRHARDFILGGAKVQITTMFSGREMQHKELGIKIVDRIKEELSDISEVDGKMSSFGTRIFLTLSPKKAK